MESSPFTPVDPVRPVAPYLGGKRNLAKRLVALIEKIPHDAYAEPFVGMGGVFLRRRMRPPVEFINDAGRDVYNLYPVLQEHYQPFIDLLRWKLSSRAEFERLLAIDPSTLTDMQRAARFLYLQRIAFGGKPVNRNYGVQVRAPRFDVTRVQPMLEDLRDRLSGVTVECLGFEAFIRRYDRPGMLFFIDPPYWGGEGDYGPGLFSRTDYEVLRGLLQGLQGRFVMTLNDVPAVRETFAAFELEAVSHTYRVSGGPTEARELIITDGRGFGVL
ncbi:MAG TPA: DNA adenine methylase [Caulobacter sp.]|nr:DNA adenine methylase [Caulobacter sp.]